MTHDEILHELNILQSLTATLVDHLEHSDGGHGSAVASVIGDRLEHLAAAIDRAQLTEAFERDGMTAPVSPTNSRPSGSGRDGDER